MRRPPAHEGGPGVAIGARRTHAMEDIEARRRTHGRRRRLEAQPASGSRAARTRENVTGRERKRERGGDRRRPCRAYSSLFGATDLGAPAFSRGT